MSFNNLIGNEEVKYILNNIIENNKILHSYLFQGQEGIGKKEFAKEFAKMILCTEKKIDCNSCKSCIEFESDNHPDFFEISPENNSIKINKIRDMQTTILEKPIISKRKVYIIDDADTLTNQAQNCLLKTLEEPPEYITIILVSSNENKLLTTIKSRCTKILFKEIDDNLLEDFLKKHYNNTSLENNLIQFSQGSIKKAIKLQEKKETYEELYKIFSNIESYNTLDVLNNLNALYKNKEEIDELLDYVKLLLYKKVKDNYKYISYIEEIEKTKNRLRANSNYDMCIDRLIIKIWEDNH